MLAELYNAELEERFLAFRMAGKSLGLYDQFRSLTLLRQRTRPGERFRWS